MPLPDDITGDPDEWIALPEFHTWQHRKYPQIYSDDAGLTWYDMEEEDCFWCKVHRTLLRVKDKLKFWGA